MKSWFAAVEGELATVEVEGVPMYVVREHLDGLASTAPVESVRLLGAFDRYVLGAGTSATYLIPAERRGEVSPKAGWISPVVLCAGRVAGVREPKGDDVAVSTFEDVPADALATEIARIRPLLS